MKPISLEIEGFNSFEKKQVIDFEKLTSLGLFGIFGNTGSGKTTILDAIIYALYEKTPRNSDEIVNINCKKMSVKYIFSIKGSDAGTYEVQRSVSVGKSLSKKAKITKLDNETVIASEKKTEVDKKIEEIIGLSYQDFIKTVVLPQGEFSSFLKEKNKTKKEMLERLFSLQKYGDELEKKMRLYKAKYEEIQKDYNKEMSSYEMTDENSIETLQKELKTIENEIETLQKEYKILDELKKEHLLLKNLEEQYKNALEKYNETLGYSERIKTLRQKVEKLSKLSVLQETIKIYEKSKLEIVSLKQDVEELQKNIEKLKCEQSEKQKTKEVLAGQMEELPQLQKQVDDIEKAIYVVKNIENLKKEKLQLTQKNANITIEKEDKEKKLEQSKLQSDIINETIKQIEDVISKNTYKYEYKEYVRTGVNVLTSQKNISLDIQKLEMERETNIKNKTEKEKIISEKIELARSIERKIDELKKNISVEYTTEKYIESETNINKMNNIKAIFLQTKAMLEKVREELKTTKENIVKLDENRGEKSEQIKNIQEKIQKRQRQELINELIKDMHDGDECPICNGIYHKDHSKANKIEIEYKDNVESYKDELSSIEQKLAIAKNTVERLEKEESELQKNIEDIKTENEITDESAIDSMIEKCQKYKAKYESYIKEKTKNEEDIIDKEKQLNAEKTAVEIEKNNVIILTEKMEKSDEKISLLKADMKNISISISDIEQKISLKKEDMEQKLAEILSAEKMVEEQSSILSKNKENLKKLLEEQNILTQQCKNIDQEINNLKLKLQNVENEIKLQYAKVEDKSLLENIELSSLLMQGKNKIEKTKTDYKKITQELELIEKDIATKNIDYAKTEASYNINAEQLKNADEKIQDFAVKNKFADVQEVFVLNSQYPDLEKKKASIENFDKTLKEHEMKKNLSKEKYDEQNKKLSKLEEMQVYDENKYNMLKQDIDEKQRMYGSTSNKLDREKEVFEKKKELIIKKSENQKVLDEVSQIEQLLKGKALVQFLAKYQLSYVCKKSSEILENISAGRFNIDIDDDGEFIILDYKNGGVKRNPSTLSGGETFLVSLSLALALSSQIQLRGNAPLEFFFMDEGFGTLDSQTLDIALDCLRKIKNENLSIGIISHIDKIKQAVPIKLEIKKDDVLGTSSSVKIVTG